MRARPISCCFSGYRTGKLPWGEDENDPRCTALKRRLRDAIEAACDEGYTHFICGMASGVDLYCCEIVQELRRERPITLEAAIPCEGQADTWPTRQRARYEALLHGCDYETLVQREYTPGCMQRRNRYMVDHASLLIAVFDGQEGGTRRTIEYALQQGLHIIDIPPVLEETDI
ncbi:MAG: DUF1273 domain-containing protein [Ruminococcaceae bacterium]|nr:DUF1273 domain-containing protein [Oscillospiraceae bacterium]